MRVALLFLALLLCQEGAVGDPIAVRHPQGLLRGFVVLRAQDGAVLAGGDLNQTTNGARVTNHLLFRFKDGSVHEETTVFSQSRTIRLINYRLVQKGPAFKRPTDLRLDGTTGKVSIAYTDDDGKAKTIDEQLKVPADLANGLIPTLLTNIDPQSPKTTVSMVVSTPKPRIVGLEISPDGEESFSFRGFSRKAKRYVAKISIGGVAGVLAPIAGKQPPDTHLWMIGGRAPSFLKSEGPLCDGCPIWRIELASPAWAGPETSQNDKPARR